MEKFTPKPESEEDKWIKHLHEPVVTDYDQFTTCFTDAQNQFNSLLLSIKQPLVLFEQLKQKPPLHFVEYLKTQNKIVDDSILERIAVQHAIKKYDEFVDKLTHATEPEDIETISTGVGALTQSVDKSLYNYIYKENQFWDTALDLKNQFVLLQQDYTEHLPIEKILENNKTRSYKPFDDLLKEKEKTISNNFREKSKFKNYISTFNSVSKSASAITSLDELKQIMEEIDEFLVEE